MSFLNHLKARHSIYALGNNVKVEDSKIIETIKDAVRFSPSAFHSQSSRVVILLDNSNQKLWQITDSEITKVMHNQNEEAIKATKAKIANFAKSYGTVLFFEDTVTIKNLQEKFALYASNFPIWSEQHSGIAQNNVWVALTELGLGANLQHYNPVIDAAVAKEFNINPDWKLRAQLVFGEVLSPGADKPFISDEGRFVTIK